MDVTVHKPGAGGLANRIRPHLLDSSFAQELLDADVVDGSVRPFREPGLVQDPDLDELIYQNGSGTRSLVEVGNEWYWSDNDTSELGSTAGYWGLEPPDDVVVATPKDPGNRFIGRYRYAVTYATDLATSAPLEYSDELSRQITEVNAEQIERTISLGDIETFDPRHDHRKKNRVGYDEGAIVQYEERAYECISRHTAVEDRDTELPGPPPDFPEHWRDITSDVEANVVKRTGYDRIELILPQPSQEQVERINIYRSIADGQALYWIGFVEVGTHRYVDTASDSEVQQNEILDLTPAYPPVYTFEDNAIGKQGGKYLTLVNGVAYLAVGSNLHLSQQNRIHSWNIGSFQEFEGEITGIAAENRGVLVFTQNRTYHVTGTTSSDIVVRWMPENQGCPNWRTITYVNNQPVWLSNDGVCIFGFVPEVNQERITIETERKHTMPSPGDVSFGVAANRIYYLFRNDGFATCMDFGRGGVIYERTLSAAYALYDKDQDRLLLRDGFLYELDAGDELNAIYRTPDFGIRQGRDGVITGTMYVRRFRLNATGPVTLELFVDGRLFTTLESDGTAERQIRPPRGAAGTMFSVRVTTKSELRYLTSEFHSARK